MSTLVDVAGILSLPLVLVSIYIAYRALRVATRSTHATEGLKATDAARRHDELAPRLKKGKWETLIRHGRVPGAWRPGTGPRPTRLF